MVPPLGNLLPRNEYSETIKAPTIVISTTARVTIPRPPRPPFGFQGHLALWAVGHLY